MNVTITAGKKASYEEEIDWYGGRVISCITETKGSQTTRENEKD